VDGVEEGGASGAGGVGVEFGEAVAVFVEALETVDDRRGRGGEVAGEAEVVAEAEGEGRVLWTEDFVEEGFDVLDVALEEFALRVGDVDEEADFEGEFGFAGEGSDLLGDSVFGDVEVIFGEAGDGFAVCVVDAEGEGDEVDFGMEGGVLRGCGGREEGDESEEGDLDLAHGGLVVKLL